MHALGGLCLHGRPNQGAAGLTDRGDARHWVLVIHHAPSAEGTLLAVKQTASQTCRAQTDLCGVESPAANPPAVWHGLPVVRRKRRIADLQPQWAWQPGN
jgi:hypothetical protein